ncbi:MAG: hypothetical protein J5719_01265 [Bacteroidales bacterium]|nr:hypothetical protein [Bacteroidales bacterium]
MIVAAAVVWIVKRIYDRTHNDGCDCGCGCSKQNGDCQCCIQERGKDESV